jgi:hypothetical protein
MPTIKQKNLPSVASNNSELNKHPITPTVKAYAQVRYYDSVKDIDSLSGSIGISGQF